MGPTSISDSKTLITTVSSSGAASVTSIPPSLLTAACWCFSRKGRCKSVVMCRECWLMMACRWVPANSSLWMHTRFCAKVHTFFEKSDLGKTLGKIPASTSRLSDQLPEYQITTTHFPPAWQVLCKKYTFSFGTDLAETFIPALNTQIIWSFSFLNTKQQLINLAPHHISIEW